MSIVTDNETWVVDAGFVVVRKHANSGFDSLDPFERLVYSLWVADYGMRNAGDLETASDVYSDFMSTAKQAAQQLLLSQTLEAFSLSRDGLEEQYFDRFEAICDEIKAISTIELPKKRPRRK